jgi:hypothetical protein
MDSAWPRIGICATSSCGGGLMAFDQTDIAQMLENALCWLNENDIEDLDVAQISAAEDRLRRRLAALTGFDVELPSLWPATELADAEQPDFLARDRLVRAAVNLLIGDEGIGKSLFWVWVVAALTTGSALPEFGIPARAPADVVLVLTEDDWSSVVRPRLDVAGADLSRIKVLCVERDGSGSPVFPRDLGLIRDADPAPVAVVVDAWLDTVPASMSVRDPQQARQALHPWKEVATSTGAAVLLVCHTNRVTSANARDRYGATGVLRQKARLTLFAQQNDEGDLLIGPEKSNLTGAIAASKFHIVSVQHFTPTDNHDGTVPRLGYIGESERTARDHIADSADGGGADEPGGNPAQVFLADYLTHNGGELNAADALRAGRAAGFTDQELKDARRRSRKPRIASRKASFGDGWVWAIVTDEGGGRPQGGTGRPEGGEDGTQEGMPPSPPPSPPSPPSSTAPPGAPSDSTPGMTHRVKLALANAKGLAQADDRCGACGTALTRPESVTAGLCAECQMTVGGAA